MKLSCALFLIVLLGAPFAAGQTFTEFPVPLFHGGLPAPARITAGPDGNLWFTVQTTASVPYIGRITPAGVVTAFGIPTAPSGPLQIAAGPDGNLWFTESFTNSNRIGSITTSGTITEFRIPTPNSEAVGIAAGPDGALWFTEHSGEKIGRITTSGAITEFVLPRLFSGASGIAAGPDGALWFAEEFGNKIGRITTSGAITEFPVPTPDSGPMFITGGPDGALWFTEFNVSGKVGRMTLGPLTCEPNATTMCLNGGRFRVTADWRTPDGRTGQGQAVSLTSDSGYFWFFSPTNIEILTKVLNACVDPFNSYWVFSAGLTNVEVTLRVVDTQRGLLKTYVNPLNSAYQPIQDTSAFATCP